MSILEHFWEPPGIQNGALERPGRPKVAKRDVSNRGCGGPGAALFRPRRPLRPKAVLEATLVDFWNPLGHLGRYFDTHWGSQGSMFGVFWQPVFEHFHAATFRRCLGPAECASAMQSTAPGKMEGARVFETTIIIPMQNPQYRRGLPLLTSPVAPRIPPGHPTNPGGSFKKPQNSYLLRVHF